MYLKTFYDNIMNLSTSLFWPNLFIKRKASNWRDVSWVILQQISAANGSFPTKSNEYNATVQQKCSITGVIHNYIEDRAKQSFEGFHRQAGWNTDSRKTFDQIWDQNHCMIYIIIFCSQCSFIKKYIIIINYNEESARQLILVFKLWPVLILRSLCDSLNCLDTYKQYIDLRENRYDAKSSVIFLSGL